MVLKNKKRTVNAGHDMTDLNNHLGTLAQDLTDRLTRGQIDAQVFFMDAARVADAYRAFLRAQDLFWSLRITDDGVMNYKDVMRHEKYIQNSECYAYPVEN